MNRQIRALLKKNGLKTATYWHRKDGLIGFRKWGLYHWHEWESGAQKFVLVGHSPDHMGATPVKTNEPQRPGLTYKVID